MLASISVLISGSITVSVQRGTCHLCTDWRPRDQNIDGYVFVKHDLYYCAIVTFYVCVCYLVPQIKVWTEFIINTLSSRERSGDIHDLFKSTSMFKKSAKIE